MDLQDTVNTILDVVNKGSSDSTSQEQVKADLRNLLLLVVDSIDSNSTGWFQAGWRPAVGWTCAGAFLWSFVLQPMLALMLSVLHLSVSLPVMDMHQLMPVLIGMLGLGGLRTYEKVKHWHSTPVSNNPTDQ